MTDAYRTTEVQGHTLDNLTYAAFLTAQARGKGGDNEWTITQGSYNTSVSQSGGTHDGGGAFDLTPFNADQRVHALRAVGFAAWHRLPSEGDWPEHIHAELIGNRKASTSAKAQWASYLAGRNGLVSNLVDRTWHPDPPVTFGLKQYVAWKREQAEIARRAAARDKALDRAIDDLITARANTDGVEAKNDVQAVIEKVRGLK